MDFFDDLGKKIGETVKVVGDKSQELLEIGRLNIEIGKEEAIIKKTFIKIGNAIYRAYRGEDETAETIDYLCNEIEERQERIDGFKDRIQELKSH